MVPLSSFTNLAHATIRIMKRTLAAAFLFAMFACPSFAATHSRPHHQHANYKYRAPKYKYKTPHIKKQHSSHHTQ
jgi:hypothetical protein